MPARNAKKRTSSSPAPRPRKKPATDLMLVATETLDRYGVPGAAVLAGGAALATAILLRDPLARMASGALRGLVSGGSEVGESLARELDLGALLARIGLRRRHGSRRLGVGLGVLGGLAAASALAAWLIPVPAGDATMIPGAMPFHPSADPRREIDATA